MTLKKVYYAIVHSVYSYAIAAWGGANETHLKPIHTAMKFIIKIILQKNSRYPSNLLFKEFNVPTFQVTYLFTLLKTTSENSVTKFNLTPIGQNHSYRTRQRTNNNVSNIQVSHSHYYCSPEYNVIRSYNRLPSEVKLLSNTKSYYKNIKKWLEENLNEEDT